jgi:hypothetical protein
MKKPDICSTVSAKGPSVISAFDFGPRLIVRALLLWASPAPPSHGAATRLEQLGEFVVGVEGGLVIGLGAGLPLCLVVGGEHDDVVGHHASFR